MTSNCFFLTQSLGFAQITIKKFSTTFCMRACVIVCSVLWWVILDLSARANVCFDCAHLYDPWTIIHIYYYHISSVSCKSLPFVHHCALRNLILFYSSSWMFLLFDKVWENDSSLWIKYLCFCLNDKWGEQFESRNEIQLHHEINTVIYVSLFHCS